MAEWDVCIVGAGPVGLTAAALLTARGCRVLVVDRAETTSDEPKAISLDDESLRTYQQAGIVDDVLGVIVPGTGTAYYDSENKLLFKARAAMPRRLGYPFKNPFAQPDLERVLLHGLLRRAAATVWFGTEVIGLEQSADAVHLSVASSGEVETVSASYVLGADGGRSTVRSQLSIRMSGRSHDEVWLVVDTRGDSRAQRYGMHHGDPRRPHVIVPGLDGRCRYEFLVDAAECEPGTEPPFALVERLVSAYRPITLEQVERAVAYRFHGLIADQWRLGRVFLLGDAAHMMPPFAGQGLNSGIRDAANLAWKIAAAVSGRGSETLLESYQLERKPHAEAVMRSSERLGRVVMTTNVRLAAFRDEVIRRALATAQGRVFFEEMRYRPVARFEVGIVQPGPHALAGSQLGQPLVFNLSAHAMVLLDSVLGDGWALLGVETRAADWALAHEICTELGLTKVSIPLDETMSNPGGDVRVAIDLDGALVREVESARGQFVLVRPDRFIAAVVPPEGLQDLAAMAASWFTSRNALIAQ